MGKHIFTLSLKMEIEAANLDNGESGALLAVSPETLYTTIAHLRNELLTDIDDFTAGEFEEAMNKAGEINSILAQMEEFASFEINSDDDDDDDDDEV